jgi:hypothetical protein
MARSSFLLAPLFFALALSPAATTVVRRSGRFARKRIAFAAFVTGLEGEAWEDAAAVLAHGIHEAARRSRHNIEAVVLAPDSLAESTEKRLIELGFDRVVKRPVPVRSEEIQDKRTREEMQHVQGHGNKGASFSLIEESIKYQAIGLTEYDRVLILDLDTMILHPMDAIMDAREDVVGTYDVEMEKHMHNAVPVVQGGFILVRPNATDLEEIKRIYREGKFDGGGWQNSHIGYAYGGVGPQGMFSYYYHKELLPTLNKLPKDSTEREQLFKEVDPEHPEYAQAPSVEGKRFLALDRRAYDVLDTGLTQAELKGEDAKTSMARLKAAHFTGGCAKPWNCAKPRTPLCTGLTDAWWGLRSSLAATWGVTDTPRCRSGDTYQALARPKKQ